MLGIRTGMALGLLLMAADAHAGFWTTLNSQAGAPAFNALAVFTPSPGSASLAAVGDDSQFMYSNDGVSWTSLTVTANPENLRGLASNDTGTMFVIVGDSGTVLYSPDYIRWLTQPGAVPGNANLRAVAFGHGLFVAGGDNGTLITSTSGFAWTPAVSGTSESIVSIKWTGTVFVAALQGGSQVFLTSSDGVTWAPSAAPAGLSADSFSINRLRWTGSQLLAVGSHQSSSYSGATLLMSSDGLNWSVHDAALPGVSFTDISAVTMGSAAIYVAVTAGAGTYASYDAATWGSLDSSTLSLNAILGDGSYFYAVGPNQTIVYTPLLAPLGGGGVTSGVTLCTDSAACSTLAVPNNVAPIITGSISVPPVTSGTLSISNSDTGSGATTPASASSGSSSSGGGGGFELGSSLLLLLALRRRRGASSIPARE